MGRITPARAFALLAALALLGPACVTVAPAARTERGSQPAVLARAAATVRPAHAHRSAGTRHRSAVARAAPVVRSGRAKCPSGLVTLTFDDGPNPAVTARLVRTLLRLKVPATFFMIGEHVHAHPALARLVERNGFTIGNHTWSHPVLTDLSDKQIRHQLHATAAAFSRHRLRVSRLMRPPYGALDGRVRRVIRRAGLVPVRWTIDSRDWAGGGPSTIARRILDALRPHRTNVVLQHDGVDNSPATLAAVPLVVERARERGYCFRDLRPAPARQG